ncbi:MAG: endolytic transglycosylase MltG [Mailhella sp.]|nr:endolytic transglycosylase MltG [Mailhella sp.]
MSQHDPELEKNDAPLPCQNENPEPAAEPVDPPPSEEVPAALQDCDSPSSEDVPSPEQKKRHPLLTLLVLMLVICFGAGIYGWYEVRNFLDTAPETPGHSIIIDIEPGMTLTQVSERLETQGIITDAQRFQLLARWENKGRSLQAGRFLLNTGWQPAQVLDMLASGKSMLYKLTLREGLPWWNVAAILEQEGFCKAEDFAKVIRDPEFLHHWSIPFDSAEGFLFPETYLLPHPRELDMAAARTVADRLVEMFWKQADKIWPDGRPAQSDLKRLVTLASIVEKETSVPSERARVAGVYTNRLKRNMLLQADPTVIYGMGPDFKGRLLYKHLDDKKNPYNTYQNPGLPPGPICSFGSAALQAALAPEDHKFLYFVATGKGREHTFSKTLSEHNRAVQEYRAIMRKKK